MFVVGGDEPVLVVHSQPAPPEQGASVSVSGHIDSFDPERLSADLAVSFDAAVVGPLIGRRCVVATAIEPGSGEATDVDGRH